MKKHVVGALAAALVVHFAALYIPGSPEPGAPLIPIPHIDKLVHVGLFAVPAFLLRRLTAAWWPIILLALHAPVSELIQFLWIPHRSGDLLDLLADVIGVGLGVWASSRWRPFDKVAARPAQDDRAG